MSQNVDRVHIGQCREWKIQIPKDVTEKGLLRGLLLRADFAESVTAAIQADVRNLQASSSLLA